MPYAMPTFAEAYPGLFLGTWRDEKKRTQRPEDFGLALEDALVEVCRLCLWQNCDDCRLVRVEDHISRGVSFAYDQAGDLVVVTDTRGFIWTYAYSGTTHLLYEVTDPNLHLVERTEYDAEGRAVRQWVGDESQPSVAIAFDGGRRVITDALGVFQTVSYDARNTWSGTEDAAGGTITRTYDANFNLSHSEDANGNATEIAWNDCGCRPAVITDSLGSATRMSYDERNNLTSYTDAADHTTTYYYAPGTSLLVSSTNELDLTTYYTYSDGLPGVPDGLLVEMASPGDRHSRYQYDSYGQLLSTAVLSGAGWITTTTSAYDDLGRVISSTDALEHHSVTFYDLAGHVTRTVQNCTAGSYAACRAVEHDPDHPDRNVVTEYGYDPAGNRTHVTNTLGIVTFYEYGSANRLIRTVENYDPGREQNEDNVYNITTRYGYDPAGNQVMVTDTLGMVTRTFYDELNRVVSVTVNYVGSGAFDPAYPDRNITTYYGYDLAGNQVTVTNALGMVTLNEYDPLNRLMTTTANYTTNLGADPATYRLRTVYGYDRAGNQVTVTNPLGVQTVTEYDPLNRAGRTIQNYQDGVYDEGFPDQDVYTRYQYDQAGRQSAVGQIGLYTTTYGYDPLGRQTTATDPLLHTVTRSYDVLGRLRTTTDANGSTTTYGYDALGRTVALTDALTHTTRYAFDGLGRRTLITDAAGIATRYEYDLLGRLITVTENYSATGPVDEQTNVRTGYGYNALGNRVRTVDGRDYTTTYGYDALSRLITETDALDHTWEYGYDRLGRRTVVTDPVTVTAYLYDPLGRLRQVEYGGEVSATYGYNALGSRVAMSEATGVTAYLYDDLGRTLLVTHSVGASVAYTVGYGYDGRGLRTRLFYPNGTAVTYSYDLAGRLTAVDGVTTTYAVYDYDDGNRLISTTLGNGVATSYGYDDGGNLLAITNTHGGDLLSRFAYSYDRTGNRTQAVETIVATGGEELWGEGGPAPPAAPEPPVPAEPPAAPGPFQLYLPLLAVRWQASVVAQAAGNGLLASIQSLLSPQSRGDRRGLSSPLPLSPLVREKGAFRVSFDEQGLRYTPKTRLAEEDDYHVDFHLVQVRSGRTKLFQPGTAERPPISPPGNPDLVRYERGEYFGEEYLVTEGGVEQRFVFPQPFAVDGDLEIEGNLLGNLQPTLAGTGEVQFLSPAGETVVSYGRALVEEACGERIVAAMELTGRRLRIIIPQAWLETACFPVVVDPLIGPNFAVSTQALAGNQERASVAYGGVGRYLLAWHGAGSGSDVFAQVLSAEGMLMSGTIALDSSAYDQQYPDAAGNAGDGSYLVAWQGSAGLTGWDIYARLVYSDGRTAGSRISVYAGTYDQQYPAVAYNANDHEYLVVWRSYDTSSRTYGIYGQVIEADGALSGSVVPVYTASVQISYPEVTFNVSDTHYLVAWQQYDAASRWNVRGKIVDADGSAVTAAFDIATEANDQAVPAAAYSAGAGSYLLVWQSYVDSSSLNDVRGRWVGRLGGVGPSFDVAAGSDVQGAPDAACGTAAECLVTWERQPNPGLMYWDIYARRVDSGGAVGSAFAVYEGMADQRYPALAYNAQAGEYLPAWQDYRSGSNWDVYARRVNADGSLEGEEVLVSAGLAQEAQEQPAAAYGSAAQTHLVVWRDGRGGNGDVYGQLVTSGGALVGESFTIAGESGYTERQPAVAYDAHHGVYLVVWAQQLSLAQEEYWDIYGRRVGGDGTLLGSALALCTASGDQTAPAVAYNAQTGSFLVTWQDARAGDAADVYARAVEGGSGDLGEEFLVYAGEEYQYVPAVAANGAEGEYLVVWQEGEGGDIYGQRTVTESTTGEAFTVTVASGDQQAPALAYDPAGGAYLVVWAHDNGSDDDVHGRRVGSEGNLLGSEITVASGAVEQRYPAVAANGAGGGWTVAWEEGATNSDLHARHLAGPGEALGEEETLSAAANAQERPALSYDSGRGRYLAVWADYRNEAEGPDVYGQLCRDYTVVVDYRYDPLQRLVGADYSTGVHFGYAYDEAGNRTRLTETTPLSGTVVTTYDYDPADRLITVTKAGLETAYSWSDRGELLDDGRQEYAWDAAGRLVGVSVLGGLEVIYSYDGANDRVAVIVDGVTTTYLVDPFSPVDNVSQVLAEEANGETTRYLYGLDLLGRQAGVTLTYLAYDALSVRLHLDAAGAIAAQYRYGPFGEVMGEGPEGYGFTGEQWHEEVGLLYLRARYYAPHSGAFVSRDPSQFAPGSQSSFRPYTYAAANPLRYRDPTGLSPDDCWLRPCSWLDPPSWWFRPPVQVTPYHFDPMTPSTWQNRPLYLDVDWLPERYPRPPLNITARKLCTLHKYCQQTNLDPLLMLAILAAEGTGSFDTCRGHACADFDSDTQKATALVQRLVDEWNGLIPEQIQNMEEPYHPYGWQRDWVYYINWGVGTLLRPPRYSGGYAEDPNWQYHVRGAYETLLDLMHYYGTIPGG